MNELIENNKQHLIFIGMTIATLWFVPKWYFKLAGIVIFAWVLYFQNVQAEL